jgi:hypothetical protein
MKILGERPGWAGSSAEVEGLSSKTGSSHLLSYELH